MNRFLAVIVFLSLLRVDARGADADAREESHWLGVLQTSQSPADKAEACARLKWIGSPAVVPALAQLLTDDQLSHVARYALESMPGREAGDALRAALAATSGSNQVGIINSLGVRREAASLPDLAKLAANADSQVAAAAASALGKIGGKDAVNALEAASEPGGGGPRHAAQCDGLLAAANKYLTDGEGRQATKVFQMLYDHEKDDGIRLAAFRGLILSSEKKGIALMAQAIKAGDAPSQGAALQLASKVGGPATTMALGEMLKKLPPASQIAVLQALQQRGDRLAQSFIADLLDFADPDVRIAGCVALGDLGDETVVLQLARHAATDPGAEQAAARQALADLRHGSAANAIVKALPTSSPRVQAELIRALSDRGDSFAAPKLVELAQSGDDLLRAAALRGLALLASPLEIPSLIQLVVDSTNDDARSAAADTLAAACQHIQMRGGRVDAAALAGAAQSASREARLALLPVCGEVIGPPIRDALRAAAASSDEGLRAAGIRALCASQDEELLPDMLRIAGGEKAENLRTLGLRGAVRMVKDPPAPMPAARRVETLKSILETVSNVEGKRLVLSALATIPDVEALELAKSMLGDAEVKAEAQEAVTKISQAIPATK